MKLIAPDYYPTFRCIADQCRHSCCIGWEIDIDPETRARYHRVPGAFGARLNASIADGEVSSFRLGEGERCPMLNANGLCDLITELGEDMLCQSCADHPRFRSYFSDRTELGLGLCCEEAARLVLTQTAPMALISLEDDGADETLPEDEAARLALRGELIALVQDGSQALTTRLEALLAAVDFTLPGQDWAEVYRGLERLDPKWDACLDGIAPIGAEAPAELQGALANFAAYLLYRHLPGALEDDDIPGRMALCAFATRCVRDAALAAGIPLAEAARMFSAEVEYSEENIGALLDSMM